MTLVERLSGWRLAGVLVGLSIGAVPPATAAESALVAAQQGDSAAALAALAEGANPNERASDGTTTLH